MQAKTCPAENSYGHILGVKATLHLLNLSHMMVNSEIEGTSLSPFGSWLLLRHLFKKRMAKECCSFPWAILSEKAHRQNNRFQTEGE